MESMMMRWRIETEVIKLVLYESAEERKLS